MRKLPKITELLSVDQDSNSSDSKKNAPLINMRPASHFFSPQSSKQTLPRLRLALLRNDLLLFVHVIPSTQNVTFSSVLHKSSSLLKAHHKPHWSLKSV